MKFVGFCFSNCVCKNEFPRLAMDHAAEHERSERRKQKVHVCCCFATLQGTSWPRGALPVSCLNKGKSTHAATPQQIANTRLQCNFYFTMVLEQVLLFGRFHPACSHTKHSKPYPRSSLQPDLIDMHQHKRLEKFRKKVICTYTIGCF